MVLSFLRYILRYIVNIIFRTLASKKGKIIQDFDKILIISPHPDDEVLGCGGLITKFNRRNKEVFIIYLTKGENCNPKIKQEILINKRRILSLKALEEIHQPMNRVYFLDFVDGKINETDIETNKLRVLCQQIKPEAIFVPNIFESWDDHTNANLIIKSLTRGESIRIYEYCVWFWYSTPFKSIANIKWKNARFSILEKEIMERKHKAIDLYMEEKDPKGIPYSGTLPPVLLKSCNWKKEIYFENHE